MSQLGDLFESIMDFLIISIDKSRADKQKSIEENKRLLRMQEEQRYLMACRPYYLSFAHLVVKALSSCPKRFGISPRSLQEVIPASQNKRMSIENNLLVFRYQSDRDILFANGGVKREAFPLEDFEITLRNRLSVLAEMERLGFQNLRVHDLKKTVVIEILEPRGG